MAFDPTPYAALESASAPSFSVDGRSLFHLRGAGLQQIWEVGRDGAEPRQLTRHDERVAMLRRAPADDRILYGIDAGGDERQQLWLWDRGESRALTDAPSVIHELGAWHADGARFSLAANDRDPAQFDVLVQEVASGARLRLHGMPHEGSVGPWNRDRLIAWDNRSTGDQRPFLLDLADAQPQPVPRARPSRFSALRWQGDALMGLTDAHGADCVALCRIDPASGWAAPVFAPPGREVEAWALAPGGGLLATVENDRGYGVLRVGPADGERPIVAGFEEGVAADLAWSPDGTRLAFAWSAPERPSGLYVWRDGVVQTVWTPALDLPTRPFRLVQWAGPDGATVPGWLATPGETAPPSGVPAVIWVHGGPANQARANFRPDMQALLAAGYAVLMPNVRGSSGYGRARLESDDRELRLQAVGDLVAGRHFLAAQPGIDPARIAVMGQSYGGYMVNAAITEAPDLWKAAINLYGIADFVTFFEQTGPWRRAHRSAEYGDPVRHRALFDRISPIRHVDRVRTPLLLLHGRRDPRVPFGESEQMAEALRLRQRRVRFETFDYAGHGFVRPDDKRRLYRAVSEWLLEHL